MVDLLTIASDDRSRPAWIGPIARTADVSVWARAKPARQPQCCARGDQKRIT